MNTITDGIKQLAAPGGAGVLCAALTLTICIPAYGGKTCSSSMDLKSCVSTLDLNSVSYSGGTLSAAGVLRILNTGATQGRIVSISVNLQTKEQGGQYATIATAVAPCGTGLILDQSLPLSLPGGADVCGGANQAGIAYTAVFANVSLASGKQGRLEFAVTYDGAPNGSAGAFCGAALVCGSRVVSVRLGFVIP